MNTVEKGVKKVSTLFKYIGELSALKGKSIKHVNEEYWHQKVSELPHHASYIQYSPTEDVLLTIRKPEIEACPLPHPILKDWLAPHWNDFKKDASFIEKIAIVQDSNDAELSLSESNSYEQESTQELSLLDINDNATGEVQYVYFTDDEERVAAYNAWIELRLAWAEEQRLRDSVLKSFKTLHQLYMTLERESEKLEILAANGLLKDKRDAGLLYPILTKRVKIVFEASKNLISIHNTNVAPQVDNLLLSEMVDIHYESVGIIVDKHNAFEYHPFDEESIPEFFKFVAHSISSESKFIEDDNNQQNMRDRILITNSPMFIVRKRADGTRKAIKCIIDDIEKNGHVPPHLLEIVDGDRRELAEEYLEELSLEKRLASVGGEDIDILLSKEANKEQLEIAQRISNYNAVLVQGPPGTGKTHTIANLLGHFLAEGKNVLVTSHTKKALAVLKDKVAEDIQNLCVAILDDGNVDMERSVDEIGDLLSRHSLQDLSTKIKNARDARLNVINDLAQVRQKIYQIKFSEFTSHVYCGESLSPTEMAKFVHNNAEALSYIPGNVSLNLPLPLSYDQLEQLYQSNISINEDEERIFAVGIPNPETLLSPESFAKCIQRINKANENLASLFIPTELHIQKLSDGTIKVQSPIGLLDCTHLQLKNIQSLRSYISRVIVNEGWKIHAMADGKKGGGHKHLWNQLVASIQDTNNYANEVVEDLFDCSIIFTDGTDVESLLTALPIVESLYDEKNSIGAWKRFTNKKYITIVEESTRINGSIPKNAFDCSKIYKQLQLNIKRNHCAFFWNRLIAAHKELPFFNNLHDSAPEQIALKFVPEISRCILWYEREHEKFVQEIVSLGVDIHKLFPENPLDTEFDTISIIIKQSSTILHDCLTMLDSLLIVKQEEENLKNKCSNLLSDQNKKNPFCQKLYSCVEQKDINGYSDIYDTVKDLYNREILYHNRQSFLKKLQNVAPEWANAIVNRIGIHGYKTVPADIENAWRWKQFTGILNELTKEPFEELQKRSLILSKEYRKKTALLAKWSAWYHLVKRVEQDLEMKRSLNGWKLTMKRIGRGTGKLAPTLRQEARKLMASCQKAVPAWIMPMNKALENFQPGINTFDIVIIDEASQSDISALAVAYMAKKIIVVGDDKQVSPLAVGLDVGKMSQLATGSIKDSVPNWQLYTGNSSVYDIVSTTYSALMLKEHFRCVPEIIGFSNKLSYDYKIKPLRDTSECSLHPAIVNYRTVGMRDGAKKINRIEAENIVALIQSCISLEEYKEKTFGVISLLGEDQAILIEQLLVDNLEPEDFERHKILCGTSAQFQGDERDIIFLSLVDSNTKEGPLSLMSEGTEQSTKKRYNVAVSRAKDQLWIVHSLDVAKDLKNGDMRKNLLEYSANPNGYLELAEQVTLHSESPFEEAVGKALVARGYKLVQQWPVGAYRIDMVVVDGKKKIAVECDGERYHSGEDKIREDMERQTILERLGWHFIRIRGGAYYQNPEASMNKVYSLLDEHGVYPQSCIDLPDTVSSDSPDEVLSPEKDSPLLQEIKRRANAILQTRIDQNSALQQEAIAFALNPVMEEKTNAAKSFEAAVTETLASEDLFSEPDTSKTTVQKKTKDVVAPTATKTTKIETKTAPSHNPVKAQPTPKAEKHISQANLPLVKSSIQSSPTAGEDVMRILMTAGVHFVDKRHNGGALWIIGGPELKDVVKRCKDVGTYFTFKSGGGKATKHKDAWWTS